MTATRDYQNKGLAILVSMVCSIIIMLLSFPAFSPLRERYGFIIYPLFMLYLFSLLMHCTLRFLYVALFSRKILLRYILTAVASISLMWAGSALRNVVRFPYFAAVYPRSFAAGSPELQCSITGLPTQLALKLGCPRMKAEYIDGDYYIVDSELTIGIADNKNRSCLNFFSLTEINLSQLNINQDRDFPFRIYLLCENRLLIVQSIPRYLAPFGGGYL